MNGIIHQCKDSTTFCKERKDLSKVEFIINSKDFKTQEEISHAVCEYIDQIVTIVTPSKHLFMAIDGVPPKAKMNQQRQRRFHYLVKDFQRKQNEENPKTEKEEEEVSGTAWEEGGGGIPGPSWEEEGGEVLGKAWESEGVVRGAISPGTAFLQFLHKRISVFLQKKSEKDPLWKFRVIFSDGQRSGEGEHKLMEMLRTYQRSGKYLPNDIYCLYGLDADLIM